MVRMKKLLSVIVILVLIQHYGMDPATMSPATMSVQRTERTAQSAAGERAAVDKSDMNGVLERKLRLRSRLNTQLLYKR
jgi:hypothetical protein